MAEIICHNNGRYNFYNTISDGFRFVSSLSLDQLKGLIEEEGGKKGLELLPERLERAHRKGCSAMDCEDLEELLIVNRAGKDEARLSYEQCLSEFLS